MSKPLIGDPKNVIELWTRFGSCQIELLSGDIAALSVEDAVDIVMVSAFPGDYSPLQGTLIGSLRSTLGINVASLANHKELDLRHIFSCWLSKPIPVPNSPFKKLLCFERKKGGSSVPAQIREMFRGLVPVFNNQDHSVITPLLATGHQVQDKSHVLLAMVEGAVEWICAGLPLRKLKIVLYEGISENIQALFTQCKLKYLKRNQKMKDKIFLKKFDIFIIFTPEDNKCLNDIQRKLKQEKSDITICAEHQEFKNDAVWQDKIFKQLIECRRIITILSPAFLRSDTCLDQYNMAICCNRLLGINVLIPFYVETIEKLPSYMGLVQWIECRVRKEGETWEMLNQSACKTVVKAITEADADKVLENVSNKTGDDEEKDKYMYDVFISYSHKNPEHAETLLQMFNAIDPSLKVFYDRSALTSGSNWQNMIYQSVGECRCLIALISSTYLSSTVCTEEYNLALARYLSKDKDMLLIPVYIESLTNVPDYISSMKPINAANKFKESATDLSEAVVKWLKGEQENFLSSYILESPLDIGSLLSMERSRQVHAQYKPVFDDFATIKRNNQIVIPDKKIKEIDKSAVDIALSFASDSTYLAGSFFTILDGMYPNLNISVHSTTDQSRFMALDSAKKIVVFVSQDFLKNEHHMQELHLALNRQRSCKQNILYLIQTTELDGRPFFPRILHYDVACTDSVWREFESAFPRKETRNKKTLFSKIARLSHFRQFICYYYEYFAMVKAAEDVLQSFLYEKDNEDALVPILLNVRTLEMAAQQNSTSQSQNQKDKHQTSPNHTKDRKVIADEQAANKPTDDDESGTSKAVLTKKLTKDNTGNTLNKALAHKGYIANQNKNETKSMKSSSCIVL